jgi:ATPase family associated with various cellular activities (AAA)
MSEPHPNASATARRILAVTRLRARRLALWMEHVWRSGRASPDQGPAIGPGEVARLICAEATRAAEAAFFAAGEAAALTAETDATEGLAADPAWTTIRDVFGLSEAEADLLALLIAVELDPGLGRVVAYLHDDGRALQPTPWLAARLAGREPAPFAGTALLMWQLAKPLDEAGASPRLMMPWQVDPAVALSVFSGTWRDPAIAAATASIAPAPAAALPCLHEAARDRLLALADPRDAELVGPPGIGRQTLAAQIAGAHDRLLLAADLPELIATSASATQALTRVLRQAAITGALAYFRDADAATEADWARARRLGVPYLRGVRHPTGEPLPVALAPLTIEARLALWHHASKAPPPDALIAHRLSPAEIMRAAAAPNPAALARQRGRRPDSALLARLPCPYEWDDLVVPADVVSQLRAFEAQVRLRWRVYEEWGFGRLAHLGHGIAALFGGPSGTGKTMAAQVLARALGIELLRVDLAGVVNKYIGETEKKLREVFDACEDSGALLFFDEADALFGMRTQVKDAHDRFANIEIDYLLQRVERFDGVAILATNRRKDLDPAFVLEERLALWQRALLTHAPNGDALLDDLDWGYLAQRLHMTGAEIKGTALGAAFTARAEGTRIGMRHLLAAAQREMAKQGVRLRVPLQEAGR